MHDIFHAVKLYKSKEMNSSSGCH